MNYLNKDFSDIEKSNWKEESKLQKVLSGIMFVVAMASVYILYFIIGS